MSETRIFILDSYAVIAHLESENGAAQVLDILAAAARDECQVLMSLFNLGEVAYIIEREYGLARTQAVLAALQQLPIQILPVDTNLVLQAAHIKANHRISLADAFAAAAALEYHAVLVTGDPEFHSIESIIAIEWLSV